MHRYDDGLARAVFDYLDYRIRQDPPRLDGGARDSGALRANLAASIGRQGKGPAEVLRLYTESVAPTVFSADSPRFLSFVPAAPTKASLLFDMVVSAASMQGISWLEAEGVVGAENQALRVLADAAGMPESAGGTFVPGGTQANLWSLVVAREAASRGRQGPARRLLVAVSESAHSSVRNSIKIIGAEALVVPTPKQRLGGGELRCALDAVSPDDQVIAVVATAGSTNAGFVDNLAGVAGVCQERGIWFHVDAAYGGAALFSPRLRPLFDGIESADSLVIDPHKWLFAPYDCSALLYRQPALARSVYAQPSEYYQSIHDNDMDWNPTDYAHHMTRRARGLPLWFSMAVHGIDAYRKAIEATIERTWHTVELIRQAPHLDLVQEPELSVVLFRRLGWTTAHYHRWCKRLVDQQIAFVMTTAWEGETVARLVFTNPETKGKDVEAILDSMAA